MTRHANRCCPKATLGVRYPLPTADAGGEVKGSTSFILGANLRSLKNALTSKSSGAIIDVVSESVEDDGKSSTGKTQSKAEKKKNKELLNTVENGGYKSHEEGDCVDYS